jgi:glycopeptide antibiotics resistance protein
MPPLPHYWLEFRYPTMLPVGIAAFVLATILRHPVARRLKTHSGVAWLLMAGLGGVLALTIAPSRLALTDGVTGPIQCNLSRIGLAPLSVYARMEDPFLNVVVFVPLGLAVGLLPPGRPKLVIAIAALLLPLAIETTQALVVAMGRSCEAGDVFDNEFGLLVGSGVGLLAQAVLLRRDAPA